MQPFVAYCVCRHLFTKDWTDTHWESQLLSHDSRQHISWTKCLSSLLDAWNNNNNQRWWVDYGMWQDLPQLILWSSCNLFQLPVDAFQLKFARLQWHQILSCAGGLSAPQRWQPNEEASVMALTWVEDAQLTYLQVASIYREVCSQAGTHYVVTETFAVVDEYVWLIFAWTELLRRGKLPCSCFEQRRSIEKNSPWSTRCFASSIIVCFLHVLKHNGKTQ